MKSNSRIWIAGLLLGLLALFLVPELLHSYSHYQSHQRHQREHEKVLALIRAGDSGYDELVSLLPTLWFPNVSEALTGILAREKRDRVADLCRAYSACRKNQNAKTAIARALGTLRDPRASTVLLKDLESVWDQLALIQYDTQIEVLGQIKSKEAADLLLKILRHQYSWKGSSWKIKENTFVALGRIGDERAIVDAKKYLESQADWYITKGALNYLTRINNTEAKAVLWKAYQQNKEPDVALCLVQIGENSVLPDVRSGLKTWLDNFAAGGWTKTDYWGVFYYVQALLIAQDREALPQLQRAFALFKNGNEETKRYVAEAPAGYTSKVLVDEERAEKLLPELADFVGEHTVAPAAEGPAK